MRFQPRAVVGAFEFLVDEQILDVVEVDGLRHVEPHSTDEHIRVGFFHVETSQKAECAVVERRKTQLDASSPVNDYRVGQVVFVEVYSDARQRTHEAVLHNVDVVVEDVNVLQHVFHKSLDALFVEDFVDACTLDARDVFLLAMR